MPFKKIKTIIFDFDGVILDSMDTRDKGFYEIFKNYPTNKVDELIVYHRHNGGLSRFHKIKYFYNEILGKDITQKQVSSYAEQFTQVMRKELVNTDLLIQETVDFIIKTHKEYELYIASGSEQNELRYLCKEFGIAKYFREILGSPTSKDEIVNKIIEETNSNLNDIVLIGDSVNDYTAAQVNHIKFYGYNNEKIKQVSDYYINSFVAIS